ncbi:MAG: glycosyltransferase family 39 protein [Chloroflexi bacterium]|nr:glycosyltransferase family 39 protein [Chloroflexota bacterium]
MTAPTVAPTLQSSVLIGTVTDSLQSRRTLWVHAAYAGVVLIALGAIIAPRVASAILPLTSDQGLFITAGEILKRGGVVGRDTWDTKPPALYYLYAGVLELAPDYSATCAVRVPFGPVPEHTFPCAQIALSIFDAVYTVLLSVAVGWVGRRLYGEAAGALAGLLCAVFGSMLQLTGGGGVADLYILLPTTLAYAAALNYGRSHRLRWLVLAGVLGGVAGLVKQTGFVLLAGVGVWALGRAVRLGNRSRWAAALAACAALTCGAAAIVCAVGILLARAGALRAVIDQAVLFNLYYVGRPANVNGFLDQLVGQTWAVFSGSQAGLWVVGLTGLALVCWRPRTITTGSSLVVCWLVASAATVLSGGAQLHLNYYLVLVPPLSVLGSYAITRLWRMGHPVVRVGVAVTSVLLLAGASEFQYHQYGNAWLSRIASNTHSTEEFVAGAVSSGSGSLFVWGNGPQVYALSGRIPATRYLHTIGLSYDYAFHTQLQQNRAEVMTVLEHAPPQVIAIDTPWLRRAHTLEFPELEDFLARQYELANSPANPIFDGWRIYRRKAS